MEARKNLPCFYLYRLTFDPFPYRGNSRSSLEEKSAKSNLKSHLAFILLPLSLILLSSSSTAEIIKWGNVSGGLGTTIDLDTGIDPNLGFTIGNDKPAYNYGSDIVWIADDGPYTITFSDGATLKDTDGYLLLNQTVGDSYKFISAESGIAFYGNGIQAKDFNLKIKDKNSNSDFTQNINQNNVKVATATYSIGNAAVDLLKNNQTFFNQYGHNLSITNEDGTERIIFDGLEYDSSTGLHIESISTSNNPNIWLQDDLLINELEDTDTSNHGFSTLTVLTELNIEKDQTLSLASTTNNINNNTMAAHLTGDGGVKYTGSGILK